eukprot:m.287335 g.287335  ORF g.287335 m.287335 type:complete len:59 (-) comp15788_c0_seq1:2068-2244(-)
MWPCTFTSSNPKNDAPPIIYLVCSAEDTKTDFLEAIQICRCLVLHLDIHFAASDSNEK